MNLASRGQVEAAYAIAAGISGEVVVERYIPGKDYRMLVVGNKLIAAARRDPPQVIGDGMHSISQLVDQVNSDPRRGEGHANSLTKIHFDEIALAHLATQGLTAESVPLKGARFFCAITPIFPPAEQLPTLLMTFIPSLQRAWKPLHK